MIRALRGAISSAGSLDTGPVFGIFGLPTRIHPLFWILILVLGWSSRAPHGPAALAIWVAVAAVSVWLHELGHALVARRWGVVFAIHLHGTGGLTRWRPLGASDWRKRAAVTAGGPAVGMFCTALAWPLMGLWTSPKMSMAIHDFVYVNAAWTLFNLLPVEPLDGGQILRQLLERSRGVTRDGIMAKVGVAAAAAAFLGLLLAEQTWATVPLVFCGLYNVERLQEHRAATTHTSWERAADTDEQRDRY